METVWTPHRFSGGALALDVANSVVLRGDPARRVDRFEDADLVRRFAERAPALCAESLPAAGLDATMTTDRLKRLIVLREAIDALFRQQADSGLVDGARLGRFLGACATALQGADGVALDAGGAVLTDRRISLEAAVALSALRLVEAGRRDRVRICENCGWLFLDRSRNGSRRWCDMSVCGNRQKARRHYSRGRAAGSVA